MFLSRNPVCCIDSELRLYSNSPRVCLDRVFRILSTIGVIATPRSSRPIFEVIKDLSRKRFFKSSSIGAADVKFSSNLTTLNCYNISSSDTGFSFASCEEKSVDSSPII